MSCVDFDFVCKGICRPIFRLASKILGLEYHHTIFSQDLSGRHGSRLSSSFFMLKMVFSRITNIMYSRTWLLVREIWRKIIKRARRNALWTQQLNATPAAAQRGLFTHTRAMNYADCLTTGDAQQRRIFINKTFTRSLFDKICMQLCLTSFAWEINDSTIFSFN